MAVAEQHASVRSVEIVRWREVAKTTYHFALGAAGAGLLLIFPPHFDVSVRTLIAVGIVTAFLALAERPMRATGGYMAPMTAIIAAGAISLGWWALLLGIVATTAVHLRVSESPDRARILLSTASVAQVGTTVIAAYAMMGVWGASN